MFTLVLAAWRAMLGHKDTSPFSRKKGADNHVSNVCPQFRSSMRHIGHCRAKCYSQKEVLYLKSLR